MSETLTVTREQLEQIVREQVQRATRHGDASSDDPLMVEAAAQPPRSFPLPSKRAEMEAQAANRGGVWLADHADVRKYVKCKHAHPTQCDKCWTPETEARWAFALGLGPEPAIALDEPEEFGSQRANVPDRSAERKRLGNPRHTSA